LAKYSIVKTIHNNKIDVISNTNTSTERADIYRIICGKLVDERITEKLKKDFAYRQTIILGNIPVESLLRQCAGEAKTDKMVQRVLTPVLLMIREGKFDDQSVQQETKY